MLVLVMKKETLRSKTITTAPSLQGTHLWWKMPSSLLIFNSQCFIGCQLRIYLPCDLLFLFTFVSCSGKNHDDMLLAKFESVYTGSGDHGSSMVSNL
jgi:hypothetical protein